MEETKRKFPSLPPNYVSLQQLQEQRLRKQQQKKEDEEEGLKEEKEKQKQQKEAEEAEEEEKKKKLLVSQKTPPRIKSYDQTSTSNRNGRNYFSQKSWLIKEKNEEAVVDQKLEEVESKGRNKKNNNRYKGNGTLEIQKGEIEINVVDVQTEELLPPDPDQNLKEIKTKKKRRKRYKGKKSMIIEEETLIEENMKESLPQATTTIPNENDADDVKNTRRTRFQRRRDQKPPPPPESMNQTMAIEQKIGDLKLCDDDDDEKKKSTVEKKKNNKKKKKNDDDYSYYSRMRSRKMMFNGNLMWIRKDEKTGDEIPVSSGGKI